ncbi:WAT1-related protein [Forsythia ovata]|uniref:WAT1-related protein n=1 Tax=Forsythia ovata TaxID=205694 RepID=A0ABD1W387_9LAMI
MATFGVGGFFPEERSKEGWSSSTFLGKILISEGSKYLILAAVLLRVAFAGLAIIAKSALAKGMSPFTFAVYRNAIATVTFAPFALIIERDKRPRMTLSILYKIILLGLLGVIEQDLYYTGMKHTTATFATTLYNILPVITFVLSWILRDEKVNFKSLHGHAKFVGTFVTVGGAMFMTFIKGPVIGLPWTNHTAASAEINHQNHIIGPLMILTACFCWSFFHILQDHTLKSYNVELSLTTLISYIYGGIICSGVAYYVAGIIMKIKGPVFVTSFNPLTMAGCCRDRFFRFGRGIGLWKRSRSHHHRWVAGPVALVVEMPPHWRPVLDENLYYVRMKYVTATFATAIFNVLPVITFLMAWMLRVTGAIVIVVGLYIVLWGKSKDQISSMVYKEEGEPVHQQISATKPCINVSKNDCPQMVDA